MKLNVGAGASRIEGFQNVDVRAVGKDSVRGHAGDLSFAHKHSVDVLFSHAVFEHVYVAHRLAVLWEWRRVLAPTGVVICIGLPDFEAIAKAYVDRSPGVTGETFDLFEAYRYTHGFPEMATAPLWSRWSPARHVNSAPSGYIPQLHKGLLDARHLSALLHTARLTASLVRYAYPGEEHSINLGFVAGAGCDDLMEARTRLEDVPGYERFCRPETVTMQPLVSGSDRMVDEVLKLEGLRAPSRLRRVRSRIKDLLQWPDRVRTS
jgi:hypothetical protein